MARRLRAVPDPASVPPGPGFRPAEGVDYSFLLVRQGVPVLWPAAQPIVVRTVGRREPALIAAMDEVVPELCELTGNVVDRGEHDQASLSVRLAREIRVLAAPLAATPPGTAPARPLERVLGVGGAAPAANGTVLECGWAVVDVDRCAAAGVPVAAVLRHELGHALGLRHANRSNRVMSREVSVRSTGWSAADAWALQRCAVRRWPSVSHC